MMGFFVPDYGGRIDAASARREKSGQYHLMVEIACAC